MHVYLATTKKPSLDNDKHIEANAQALEALGALLTKTIYVWFLIVIPPLQCGTL